MGDLEVFVDETNRRVASLSRCFLKGRSGVLSHRDLRHTSGFKLDDAAQTRRHVSIVAKSRSHLPPQTKHQSRWSNKLA
jgi:hypothetical protein